MNSRQLKKWLIVLCFLALALCGSAIGYNYYSYIFAKVVDGRVVGVSRITSAVEGYVIAMRVGEHEVLTAKTDDPKWALVTPGQCAQAKFFPHPPWNLDDSGTYFRATLLLIRDCTDADGPLGISPAADTGGAAKSLSSDAMLENPDKEKASAVDAPHESLIPETKAPKQDSLR